MRSLNAPMIIPTPRMSFSCSSSPFMGMNWIGSPQTHNSFTSAFNTFPHSQGIIRNNVSPIAKLPKMDTFGDCEGLCLAKNGSFGESPVNFALPYCNVPTINLPEKESSQK